MGQQYLNKKAVRGAFHRFGKQISKEGVEAMDAGVLVLVSLIAQKARHFKRVTKAEVDLVLGGVLQNESR